MPGPTDARSEAMTYWGTITAAASNHEGAAVAAQRVAQEAARLGRTPSFGVYGEAMRLYGEATALQYGAERLATAPADYGIQGDYLAKLPYGAGQRSPTGPRVFDVRVEYDAVESGVPVHDMVTLRYTGGLPGTVGDLRADAEAVTEGLVTGYRRQLTGIGLIQIGEL